MSRGAKRRLIDILNRESFLDLRRIFGQHGGGNGPLVQDISPEAIVIGGPEKSAAAIASTFRQILHGTMPARTIVVGRTVLPFVTEPEQEWPPILYTDRGTGLRRLELPRIAHLWSLAERQGWADEVPDEPQAPWTAIPTEGPSDHPHDRYLMALNREAQKAEARLQKKTPREPLRLTVTDIEPYRITAEFLHTSSFLFCWSMDPAKELARDVFFIGFASWIRLHVFDPLVGGWIGIDERFRPREEDLGPPNRKVELTARDHEFRKLREACERIGWERGELARAVPVRP